MKRWIPIPLFALTFCTADATAQPSNISTTTNHLLRSIEAHLSRGQSFQRYVGAGLVVALEPDEDGWHLDVRPDSRGRVRGIGFASIATPPFHGPTVLDIAGWQFRNADNTAQNDGSINASQLTREFSFVTSEADANALGDEIIAFQEGKSADLPWKVPMGHGTLTIRNLKLGNLVTGARAWIESMDLTISIRFPSQN